MLQRGPSRCPTQLREPAVAPGAVRMASRRVRSHRACARRSPSTWAPSRSPQRAEDRHTLVDVTESRPLGAPLSTPPSRRLWKIPDRTDRRRSSLRLRGENDKRAPPRGANERIDPPLAVLIGRTREVCDRLVRHARGQDAALKELRRKPKAKVRITDGFMFSGRKPEIPGMRVGLGVNFL
jgi:hypothetical protein